MAGVLWAEFPKFDDNPNFYYIWLIFLGGKAFTYNKKKNYINLE